MSDDEDPLGTAFRGVKLAEGESDQEDAARDLLRAALEHGDEDDRAEATSFISNNTRYGEGQAEDWLDEERIAYQTSLVKVHKIEKVIPDVRDEPWQWIFHCTVRGDDVKIELPDHATGGSTAFETAVRNHAHTWVEFEDWGETLEEWMNTAEEVRRSEDPITVNHVAGEAVLDTISTLDLTVDVQIFKAAPTTHAYYDQEKSELLVSSEVVNQAIDSKGRDVTAQKVHAILKDLKPDGKAVRPRTPDGDRFRAWRFEAGALEREGLVDLATAFDDDDDDDGDAAAPVEDDGGDGGDGPPDVQGADTPPESGPVEASSEASAPDAGDADGTPAPTGVECGRDECDEVAEVEAVDELEPAVLGELGAAEGTRTIYECACGARASVVTADGEAHAPEWDYSAADEETDTDAGDGAVADGGHDPPPRGTDSGDGDRPMSGNTTDPGGDGS